MIDWDTIDTVFLDMDGTLLDLNFDTYFWSEHVPQRYAEKHGIPLVEAKAILDPRFRRVEGTLDWYCLDYWSRELGLDIALLKQEVDHLIEVHPHVTPFLDALRAHGKRRVLVTNAHLKSLELKMEHTRLGGHLDAIICSHDLRLPKEHPAFWTRLQKREPFDPRHTLLIDDSLPVLAAARAYGIRHLLAVRRPDSRAPTREVKAFRALHSFRDIMPAC